jgi:hypothetical protein
MNVVIEYAPSKDKKETEKMVDDLRVLGLEELRMSMLSKNS